MAAFVLKTVCAGETRRILIDPVTGFKFEDLKNLLSQQFPSLDTASPVYTDDEGDRITIASTAELSEAFRLASAAGWKSLKIFVDTPTEASAPASKQEETPSPKQEGAPSPEEEAPTGGAIADSTGPVVHWGFECDVSGLKPIVGNRFHKVGSNFDLCEAEFNKLSVQDQGAFEKIGAPARGNWWRRFCNEKQQGDAGPPRGWRRRGRMGGRHGGGGPRGRPHHGHGPRGGPHAGPPHHGHGHGHGGNGRRWGGGGCGGGGNGGNGNPLFQKCKKFFAMMRASDIEPLLAALQAAGGAAAEACEPLQKMVAGIRDDVAMRVLKRMGRSPAVHLLKKKMKEVHRDIRAGRVLFFDAPVAVLNSEEWALAVAQLRDALPSVAQAVEAMAELAPRLQAELPALLPQLFPIMIAMTFMGRSSLKKKTAAAGGQQGQGQGQGPKPQEKRHRAKFVKDATVPDGTVLAPGVTFAKTWTVTNSGDAPWPADTALLHVGGDMELRPSVARVPVGAVAPREEKQLTVDLTAPSTEGRFWSYWRLVAGDDPASQQFGLRLWSDVTVATPATPATTATPAPVKEEVEVQDAGATKEVEATKHEIPEESFCIVAATVAQAAKAMAELASDAMSEVSHPVVPSHTPTPMLGTALASSNAEFGIGSSAAPEIRDLIPLVPAVPIVPVVDQTAQWKSTIETLKAMGFDAEQFQSALKRHNGNIQAIIPELLRQ